MTDRQSFFFFILILVLMISTISVFSLKNPMTLMTLMLLVIPTLTSYWEFKFLHSHWKICNKKCGCFEPKAKTFFRFLLINPHYPMGD